MRVIPTKVRPLTPPKGDLLAALKASRFRPRDGDVVIIASKVVSIDEGRCIPISAINKKMLVLSEADQYYKPVHTRYRSLFTIARGALASSSGIDRSNGNGHYIVYPEDPFKSARRLRRSLMRAYGVKTMGVIIVDSTTLLLRRGAIGFALAWDGIDPLRDYRKTPDIFGRPIKVEVANVIDALAAAAVVEMGEGKECRPVAIIRDLSNIELKNRPTHTKEMIVELENDVFAPLIYTGRAWKHGGRFKKH